MAVATQSKASMTPSLYIFYCFPMNKCKRCKPVLHMNGNNNTLITTCLVNAQKAL